MKDHLDIRIIAVPYDSGHPDLRMGAGPEHLLNNGLGERLRSEGRGTRVTTVRHEREPTAEVATAFELHSLVSNRVRRAIADGEVPLVLSGNCNTAVVESLAGVGPETWASSGSTPMASSTHRRRPRPASSTGWVLPARCSLRGLMMAPSRARRTPPKPYSPECVEGVFSEVRAEGVPRSPAGRAPEG
jgi:hypothetical protein